VFDDDLPECIFNITQIATKTNSNEFVSPISSQWEKRKCEGIIWTEDFDNRLNIILQNYLSGIVQAYIMMNARFLFFSLMQNQQ